jgi:hypothetical protein
MTHDIAARADQTAAALEKLANVWRIGTAGRDRSEKQQPMRRKMNFGRTNNNPFGQRARRRAIAEAQAEATNLASGHLDAAKFGTALARRGLRDEARPLLARRQQQKPLEKKILASLALLEPFTRSWQRSKAKTCGLLGMSPLYRSGPSMQAIREWHRKLNAIRDVINHRRAIAD